MIQIIQTLGDATEFDGTVGKGLITFSELDIETNFPSANYKPSIVTLSLDTGDISVLLPQITVVFTQSDSATTERMLLKNLQDKSGFAMLGCRIGVPRTAGGVPWRLEVLTPGKTASATLVVEFTDDYYGGKQWVAAEST